MSFGSRFRTSPEANSLKTAIGAALVGVALLGGTVGGALAQDTASPEASPSASPVAVIDWIEQVPSIVGLTLDDDSAGVGVVLGDAPTINVAEIEIRPYIILQTDNQSDTTQNVAVFSVPAEFDAATFVFPASEADLPEGVTAIGGYQVAAGEQYGAVFHDLLTEGTYVIASDGGNTIPFAVIPAAEVEVPDIFATPSGN